MTKANNIRSGEAIALVLAGEKSGWDDLADNIQYMDRLYRFLDPGINRYRFSLDQL
jgi:hypothetical protein